MDNISINKQYNELDEYILIKDYINKVLSNFKDIDSLDSNDVYEIIYAKKLCESKLEQGIENDGTREAFEDTLSRLRLITDLLNEEIFEKAIRNDLDKSKIRKIQSSEYAKSNKVPDLPNKSKPKLANPIGEYFKKIMSRLIILSIVILITFNLQSIMGVLEDFLGASSVNAEYSNQTEDDESTEVLTDSSNMSPVSTESQNKGVSSLETIIRLVCIIIMCSTSIFITFDLMYITLPSFRCMINDIRTMGTDSKSSIISDNAIESVELENTVVGYHYSDSWNKIEAAEILLDNMIIKLRESEDNSDESKYHMNNIIHINTKISECTNKYEKIKHLADVEIYYINNKEYFDSILKEG